MIRHGNATMKFSEDSATGIYRPHSYGPGWIATSTKALLWSAKMTEN